MASDTRPQSSTPTLDEFLIAYLDAWPNNDAAKKEIELIRAEVAALKAKLEARDEQLAEAIVLLKKYVKLNSRADITNGADEWLNEVQACERNIRAFIKKQEAK